jgi:hypothetical protein
LGIEINFIANQSEANWNKEIRRQPQRTLIWAIARPLNERSMLFSEKLSVVHCVSSKAACDATKCERKHGVRAGAAGSAKFAPGQLTSNGFFKLKTSRVGSEIKVEFKKAI